MTLTREQMIAAVDAAICNYRTPTYLPHIREHGCALPPVVLPIRDHDTETHQQWLLRCQEARRLSLVGGGR